MTKKLPTAKYAKPEAGVARLVVFTQVYENYGSADEPYWKAKFGSEYCVATAGATLFGSETKAKSEALIEAARELIESDNEWVREWVIDWAWVEAGEMTESERLELEFEGSISTGCPISVEWLRSVREEVTA